MVQKLHKIFRSALLLGLVVAVASSLWVPFGKATQFPPQFFISSSTEFDFISVGVGTAPGGNKIEGIIHEQISSRIVTYFKNELSNQNVVIPVKIESNFLAGCGFESIDSEVGIDEKGISIDENGLKQKGLYIYAMIYGPQKNTNSSLPDISLRTCTGSIVILTVPKNWPGKYALKKFPFTLDYQPVKRVPEELDNCPYKSSEEQVEYLFCKVKPALDVIIWGQASFYKGKQIGE